MSEIYLRKEIKSLVRNSSIKADLKMVCSIIKIMDMKYSDINNQQIRTLAKDIISEEMNNI